jgi:hypothetical protein
MALLGGGAILGVALLSADPEQAHAAGDAGASASAGYIAAAQRGEVVPPDIEDVEHMCALLTSCDKLPLPPQLNPEDFASCVRKMADELASPGAVYFSLTMRECGLRANSCSELRSCALRGAKVDICNGRGKQGVAGMCDGEGRAITCYKERVLAVRDCPRGGEQCAVREGEALCTLGPCSAETKEGAPPTCSASGTRILRCDRGKLVSLDCAAFGLRCTLGSEGAGCAPPTPSCSGTAKRCDGNVSVGCFNGHEVRVDCAASGLSCNAGAGAAGGAAGAAVGSCVATPPAAGACAANAAAKCEGATLKYCFAGKPRSYFCKSLGFNKCVTDSKGARCSM